VDHCFGIGRTRNAIERRGWQRSPDAGGALLDEGAPQHLSASLQQNGIMKAPFRELHLDEAIEDSIAVLRGRAPSLAGG
jgi:hypothetical protein